MVASMACTSLMSNCVTRETALPPRPANNNIQHGGVLYISSLVLQNYGLHVLFWLKIEFHSFVQGSAVCHFFKLMMYRFNKTEAALFPMQPIHPENSFFSKIIFYCGSKTSYCGGLNSELFEHLILCKSNLELM